MLGRVLCIAFACAPGQGSEPGLAYGLARHVAPHLGSLVLVTPTHNRPLIETGPPLPPQVEIQYVTSPEFPGEVGHRAAYLVWLIRALRRARELHAKDPFDLVHHVTYAMSWIPPLAGRLGVPFVWNAGNTLLTPPRLLSWRHPRGALAEGARNLAVWGGWRLSRQLVHADAIILGHNTDEDRCRALFLPALELSDIESSASAKRRVDGRFRILTVGRLIHWKGIHFALRAFAQVARSGWEYLIIGSGPEERKLRSLVKQLGIANQVCFCGWLPRSRALELVSSCDVFCLPTTHDSFSWVVLEAMAAGLPVVCLDRGGPGLIVNDQVGIKIPARNADQVVQDLGAALLVLANDPERRHAMGEEARRLVLRAHTWDVRAREIIALYKEILSDWAPPADEGRKLS